MFAFKWSALRPNHTWVSSYGFFWNTHIREKTLHCDSSQTL